MNRKEVVSIIEKKFPKLMWEVSEANSGKKHYYYIKIDSLELLDIEIYYRLLEDKEYPLFTFNILNKEGEILYDFGADEYFEDLLDEGLFALRNLYSSDLIQLKL